MRYGLIFYLLIFIKFIFKQKNIINDRKSHFESLSKLRRQTSKLSVTKTSAYKNNDSITGNELSTGISFKVSLNNNREIKTGKEYLLRILFFSFITRFWKLITILFIELIDKEMISDNFEI